MQILGEMWILLLVVASIDATSITSCTNGKISLSCATTSGCTLAIQNASFIHPTSTPLPGGNCTANEEDCRTNASMVWSACEGKRQCSFTVPQERPKGACKTVSSYLEIEYKCTCVRCTVLTALPRRTVTYSTPYLTQGTIATYTCLGGYELAGPRTRMCLASGEWTNSEPVCSVPLSVCPGSSHPRRTYRSRCYEFVETVKTWELARQQCYLNNGTIVAPRSKSELYFLTMEIGKMNIYGYIWLAKDEDLSVGLSSTSNGTTVAVPTRNTCIEMYKPDPNKVTWVQRDTTCSYLNAFICAYEIDRNIVEKLDTEKQSKRTRAGIAIGISIGIIILIVGLFCIFCRDKNRNTPKGITIEEGNMPREHPMLSRDSDNDIYDDTLPECDVTNRDGSSTDTPKYAEVNKAKKRNADPHSNYDEVYTTMRAVPRLESNLSRSNTYENISVHNIMGSLKKTFIRPWRFSGSHKISDNTGNSDSTSLDSGAVIMRHKPMPAPKPAIRRSALEAKLEAIKNQKAMSASSEDDSSGSPSVSSRNGPSATILRDRVSPSLRTDPESEDKIKSGLEIVENEIYDEEECNKSTELTEL